MSRKVPPVEIPDDAPFSQDVLNREPTAKHLTSLLRTIEDPYVFALSSPYGTGKTTFVRMWQQHLENEGFLTLYYNAWENDFVDDPMVAFIDEITRRIEGHDAFASNEWQNRIEKIKSFANTVAWRTIPVGLKLLTAGLIEANDFDEQMLAEAVQGVSGEAIEQYRSMKNDVQEFRDTLTALVEEIRTEGEGNPIVLFVDELDRCRPDHAVLLLERIKHFFSIPGITFVLSLEPDQLQHSVKALYGSGFDAKGYLRRFIDVDFPLPEPDLQSYGDLLYDHHEVDEITGLSGDSSSMLKKAHTRFAQVFGWGLREQKKFGLRAQIVYRIASKECGMDYRTYIFLSFLIALRMDRPSILSGLKQQDKESHDAAMVNVERIRSDNQGSPSRYTPIGNILEACLRYWGLPLSSMESPHELIKHLQDNESHSVATFLEEIVFSNSRPDFETLLDLVDITKRLNQSSY